MINCYLAEWGYLKSTDKIDLPQGIKLLKIKNLEDIVANQKCLARVRLYYLV